MATIIDELVVKIGMDNKGLKKGSEEAKKSVAEIKGNSDKAGKSVNVLGTAFIRFFAILGGATAVAQFAKRMVDSNAELARFTDNVGLSADRVSAMQNAAKIMGSSAEDVAAAINMIGKAQYDLKMTGTSSMIPYLNYLGISLTDATGKAKDQIQVLTEMNEKFSKMDKQTAYYHGQQMGVSAQGMSFFLMNPDKFKSLMENQRKYAATTNAQAEKARQYAESSAQAGTRMEAFGRNALDFLTPNFKNGEGINRGNVSTRDVADYLFQKSNGMLTKEQAEGMAISLKRENSKFDTRAVNPTTGIHTGLGQWDKSRQADFKSKYGIDLKDATRQQQLDFVLHELRNKESNALKEIQKQQTRGGAADAAAKYYERTDSLAREQQKHKAIEATEFGRRPQSGAENGAAYQGGNKMISVKTGDIIVNTQAKDPKGIGEAVKNSIYTYPYQADGSVR